ncbi:TonB-dependent receptor [Paracidobacterium acidisoli]|uniref:Carboxypeptidase regulatory-like domain-containing protein n=1 Tax=Paracidobacterium acidisoli TaxID=2303751 RepID=A0A372IJP4_9BACT|nr:TonB-dependent receptor [Paracidobacterium acidisoli]MBT9333072.1 TonB-dependent receptor [Paracidobacterium acidisoli]
MTFLNIRRWACLMLLAVAGTGTLLAQNTTGSIVGHVTDTTGAAIPSAQVTVTNQETSETRTLATTPAGDFTVPLLKPGTYKVTVSDAGFETVTTSGIVLQVDQTVRADASLKVGSHQETVSVSASALTLDTDSASVGQVVSEKQITELPLNGRYFTDLIFLAPGAVQTSGEQSNRIESGNAISVGGARTSSNGYTLDGTSIMDVKFNTPAFNLSLDAIQEFKLQTKTYSAAYGYSVNQVTLSSKSGTNTFHGSVFEYLRNNFLDARNYFNRPPVAVAPLRQNQFGYSLGGPVFIPKIYNGRNRTFFFANYEGQRISTKTTVQSNVPTADQLKGIFTFPITDPSTGMPFPSTNGVTTIPADRISRLGQLVQAKPAFFFPLPNQTGAFNFGGSLPTPTTLDQQNYRIDHTFGPKDSIFFRATTSDLYSTVPAGAAGLNPVSNSYFSQLARNYTLVYTHIFTPALVNQFRFGYLEALARQTPYPITSGDLSALGISNIFHTPADGYPNIGFATYPGLPNDSIAYAGSGSYINTPSIGNQPLEDLSDAVSWSHGRHTINFGYGMQWMQFDTKNDTNLTGSLAFNGQFSGNQISDMLLGDADSAGAATPGPLSNVLTGDSVHLHLRNYAPYIQDDWKATPSLTINAGLRYEFHATPYEGQNQFGWFTHNVPGGALYVANPQVAATYGNGIYLYNGKRGDGPAPWGAFAPRLGFAYRVNNSDKWVVRGGYGLFYDTVGLTEFQGSTSFYPYSNSVNFTQSTSPGPISTDHLFPAPTFGPVQKSTLQSSLYLFMPQKYKVPYIQDWSLDIQRQLTPTTVLDVDYEGNKGTRLFQRIDTNQPTQCNAAHNCNPLAQTSATILARRPYQNFGEILEEQFTGWANYNAMDAKLERRSTNLTLLAVYTWSKIMDDKSTSAAVGGDAGGAFGVQNAHDIAADYARASYDVGQRFALSFVAALPVGRGKRFLGNASRLTDAVIGGWQANGIYQLQNGFPFTISATDIGGVNEGRSNRANLVGNPYPQGFHKNIQEWFNKAAFANPAPGDFGDSERNFLREPKLNLMNFSLFKDFSLVDRLRVETRLESFNTFNHPQFGLPSQNVTSSTFGTISSTARDNRELQVAVRLTF